MPLMKPEDFGSRRPINDFIIMQLVNDLILYHEECVFWDGHHDQTDQWERDLIERCVAGDRSGDLAHVPAPIY